jgi:2-polyprenyl-3-methyl-5-hydroxy-6-metoxy-1,4-benzoquinol methylase/glycosyltransferase involved in cell wall biosynthesis
MEAWELAVFNRMTENPPKIHGDGTVDWGLGDDVLNFIFKQASGGMKTLETGCGISTIVFALKGTTHFAITPSTDEMERIKQYCLQEGIPTDKISFRIGKSEDVLPNLEVKDFDIVLIDGCHGFPVPFLDWYYLSERLKVNGLVIIDDIQLWPCRVLCDFLKTEPEWAVESIFSRSMVFRKLKNVSIKEWKEPPFIVENLNKSETRSVNEKPGHETGYCVVCGCHSSFRFDPTIISPQVKKAWGIADNLVRAFNRKESCFCSYCGSSLRMRRLAAVLMQTFAEIGGISCKSFVELVRNEEFRRLKIAEISACGTLHSYLKQHPNLYYSEWLPGVKPGTTHEGTRCEDWQGLTYPDDTFDIILSSETLEHVLDPDKAWHEIYRTLKGGGFHVFTLPVVPWQRSMDLVEKLNKMGLSTEGFYLSPEVDSDVAAVFRSRKDGGHVEVAGKGPSPLLEWTGERYLPWLEEAAIGYEHWHRYAYASQLVRGKRVLDLGCGEGYGSYLLARTAASVVGIDIDENSVKHARNKYIKHNLEFEVGSITEVPIPGTHLFDVAVCFEALEHVEDHHRLLTEVKRLLTPDGVFIVSTPNKSVYSDEPHFNNPFHVHELYFHEFRELFKKYFRNVKFLGQRIFCNSSIWPVFSDNDSRVVEYVVDRNRKEFVFVENDKRIPLYFIAIASDTDREIEEVGSSLIDVSDALLKQKDGQINAYAKEQERLGQEVAQLQLTIQTQQQLLAEKDKHAHELAEDRDRFMPRMTALRVSLEAQRQALVGKDQEVAQLTAEREGLTQDVAHFQGVVRAREETLTQLQSALRETLVQKEKEMAELVAERERLSQKSFELQQYVRAIEDSLAWMLLAKYRRLRDNIFPAGTRRHNVYNSIKNSCKRVLRGRAPAPPRNGADPFGSANNSVEGGTDAPLPVLENVVLLELRQPPPQHPVTVLFLSHWIPAMDRASGALRAFTILQLLREQGCDIVFGADHEKLEHIHLFGSEAEVSRYEMMLEGLGIKVFYGPQTIMRHLNEKGHTYHFVVLSHPEIAYRYLPGARAYAIHAKVIYDPVDLHWLRLERESRIKDDDALRLKSQDYRRVERFNTGAADMVFAITDDEKTEILKEVPVAKVEVIPNIHACVDHVKPLAGRKNLLFIGHYFHNPNEDAVWYFVTEIFPLIRQQLPGVVFHMVGSHITEKVQSLASRDVIAVGYVPDLSPYLDGCRVFVAPLRYGAGMKGKIGHSMSFGLPVVTTFVGAEGMKLTDGKNVLIADSPAAFARAVVRLYTDDLLWEQISAGSLLHVKIHFSKAVVQKKLTQVFAVESQSDRSLVAEVT